MSLRSNGRSGTPGAYNNGFSDTENILDETENAIEVFNEKSLEEKFTYKKIKSDNVLKSSANYLKKYYKPSPSCAKNYFFKRFPFFDWIRKYDIKQNFVKDLIAGLTIGIVHIPQGMAYALMAGVPAINGLYVSFFTVILYVLFGTSRHLSTGTYAIVSLMVISSLNKYSGILYPAEGSSGGGHGGPTGHSNPTSSAKGDPSNYISNDPVAAKVLIAMCLSLFSGVIQIIFAILHIGAVTKYLSDSIVNGFTCGAAFHVVVSQISTLLGIKLGDNHIPFVLIGDFIEIGKNIANTKIATLIISIISIIFLYIVKIHINEKYKAKLPVPIPVELIVVVVGTVASYFGKFNQKYGVKIIGDLPLGIPTPRAPPIKLLPTLIGDSIAIAIVSFAINVSMAKLFAKKHKYEISANQELVAYGIGNIVSSFFSGFPACVGLSRCVILDGVGGKTQVYGIFSSILVLVVILFLGPLFKSLPNACLAAIIVVALKAMVLEVTIFPKLLKKSKMEAMGWLVTYLGVMILDVDVGLYIGVGFSLLLVILRSQRARTSVLGNIPGTKVYESIDACDQAKEFEAIKIIRYEESIYYANVDNFKYKIIKLSGVNPANVLKSIKKQKDIQEKLAKKAHEAGFDDLESQMNPDNIHNAIKLKNIILDFSCVNYIDSQGVNSVIQLYEIYKEIGVKLHLTYCKQTVVKSFKKQSLPEKIELDFIYVSNDDAVTDILKSHNKQMLPIKNNGLFQNVRINDEDSSYPLSVYKTTRDSIEEDDNEFYIERF
ncbi:unnamed protein product [Brachionus calyciflorus]|uniref:STAS domain-containing protein n=1 Tax=Brachionus calyciflorus TaxID=104777 RepID=A0A814DKM9_9BILA|nr:unnamed protein product [Brachionus calyciflorus]